MTKTDDQKTHEQRETEAMLELLEMSQRDVREGRVFSARETFAEARARIFRRREAATLSESEGDEGSGGA